jgi:hypothetical protein
LTQVANATARDPTAEERKRLHRIGDEPVVALLTLVDGSTLDVGARAGDEAKLLGPFAPAERLGTAGVSG